VDGGREEEGGWSKEAQVGGGGGLVINLGLPKTGSTSVHRSFLVFSFFFFMLAPPTFAFGYIFILASPVPTFASHLVLSLVYSQFQVVGLRIRAPPARGVDLRERGQQFARFVDLKLHQLQAPLSGKSPHDFHMPLAEFR